MSHMNFSILAFSTNFCHIKITCLVTMFDCKLQVFKYSPKWIIFGIFNELLSNRGLSEIVISLKNCEFSIHSTLLYQLLTNWLTNRRRGKEMQSSAFPSKSSPFFGFLLDAKCNFSPCPPLYHNPQQQL